MKAGRPARFDYEYERNGTANLFMMFAPLEGWRLVERFEWHYTPKHGSWLNLAESELGVLTSQCLDRRIPNKQILIDEIAAWEHDRNANHTKADWQFTTKNARIKLKHLYPARLNQATRSVLQKSFVTRWTPGRGTFLLEVARTVRKQREPHFAGIGAPPAASAATTVRRLNGAGELMSENKLGDVVVVSTETERKAFLQQAGGASVFLCAIALQDYEIPVLREKFFELATGIVIERSRAAGINMKLVVKHDPSSPLETSAHASVPCWQCPAGEDVRARLRSATRQSRRRAA